MKTITVPFLPGDVVEYTLPPGTHEHGRIVHARIVSMGVFPHPDTGLAHAGLYSVEWSDGLTVHRHDAFPNHLSAVEVADV